MARYLVLFSLLAAATWARAGANLYAGSAGGSPESQGWLTYAPPIPVYHAQNAPGTVLNTSGDNAIQAGWHNYGLLLGGLKNAAFGSLDRTAGFNVVLDVRILAESHASDDRAGFSLIVLGSDKKGIELGFWADEVWAQSGADFVHAEGVMHDTTIARRYDLTVLGNTYALSSDGTQILTGAVRDYTAWTPPSGWPDPYELPNFVFVGDNTTSAGATAEFTLLAVPEPGLVLWIGLAAAGMRWRRADR